MKKILQICTMTILVFSLFFAVLPVLADDPDDQLCDDAEIAAANQFYDFSGHTLAQSFSPTLNRLSSVLVGVAMGADNPKDVTVEIRKITGGDQLVATETISASNTLVTWLEFTFDDVVLNTSYQYKIVASSASTTGHWVYSTASCTEGGSAIVDGSTHADKDFGFVTYGHSVADVADPADSVESTDDASTTTSSDSTISTSIGEATTLVAEYISEDKAVKLNWGKSSTTTIDGYRIYKSAEKNKGYSRLASVDKNILEYSDNEELAEGTFYYFVRAYDGNLESANSNIVSVAVPALEEIANEEETEEVVAKEAKEPTFWQNITGPYRWYVISGLIIIALGLSGLLYYLIRKRKLKKVIT